MKAGGYIVSIDRDSKATEYRQEASENSSFKKRYRAVHGNGFPYFTDVPVS